MTTEEKAKAYDEALERAKEIKSKILSSHLSTESCKAVSEYINEIIPELRESEDERVRKGIVETIKQCPDTFLNSKNRDEMLAYLEKQKEHKPASTEDMPYITDEHFWEREPADSFKYKLAEYMTNAAPRRRAHTDMNMASVPSQS